MNKAAAILFLIIVLSIALLYWYVVTNANCKPITRCYINSINISCTSNMDCVYGTITGVCNMNTFKCVNMILDGDEEDCLAAGGEWYEKGCQ